jgi:subtilisin family serine protease
MAAPFVAGLAGLVRSQFPQLKQAEVKARIEASADDLGETGFDPKFGYGRVNVAKALAAAGVQQRR